MKFDANRRLAAAQMFLNWLDTAGYPAVICGGYARDTILDRPIRDIDLYVCNSMYKDVHDHIALAGKFEWKLIDTDGDAYVHQSVHQQAEYYLLPGLQRRFGFDVDVVNIVGLGSDIGIKCEDVCSRFNIALSQAGISKDGLYRSDNFDKDVRDKAITVLRTDWGIEGTRKSIKKLWTKYPKDEWTVRINKPEDVF